MKEQYSNYFDRKHMGGVINSIGIAQQDCASIIYLFRYLDDSSFKEMAFENTNDFTLRFSEKKEISVQVKINQFTLEFIATLLENHHEDDKEYVFIGTGFDDKFRNLYQKILRYRNAMTSSMKNEEKNKILEYIASECRKIKFNDISEINFDIIDGVNNYNLAKNAIYEWADKHGLFVDVKAILYELEAKISLCFRVKSAHLNKEDVLDIVFRHKQKKITSMPMRQNGIEYEKKFIINEIEGKMARKYNSLFGKLQLLKSYIEMDMVIEARNQAEELFYTSYDYVEIYTWLLLYNENYFDVIDICEKFDKDNYFLKLLKGRAYMFLNQWQDAISELNESKKIRDSYDANLELVRCYANLENEDKALEHFKAGKELYPERGEIYFAMGKLFEYCDECIYYMNEAIKRDANLVNAYIEKGKVLRYKGKFNEAIKCYENYMEKSTDFDNLFVLTELALSYYNANKSEKSIYIAKWIARLVDFACYQTLCLEGNLPIIDIGYEYTNFIMIVKKKDRVEIAINKDYRQAIYNSDNSLSGIGLYMSPTNRFLLKDQGKFDEETKDEKASMPALFKMFDNMENYIETKNRILNENVLVLNHEWNGYTEYCDSNNYLNVEIYKKERSMEAKIEIGNFIITEYFPSLDKGYFAFICKCQDETMFNEAALILRSPEEDTQITFCKDNIKIINKLIL